MSFLRKSWVREPIIVLAILALAAGLGYQLGSYHGTAQAVADAKTAAREAAIRDAKILAVIVKKNPAATIKDFSGFPQFLIDEANARGVDYRYVMALIDKESEWNPRAVSPVGAIGLMQIMPATAALVVKNNGLTGYVAPQGKDLGSLADPVWNVRIGTMHLKSLMDQYGAANPATSLRAYNRGEVAARQHWPGDRYAEDIALKFVALSMEIPK